MKKSISTQKSRGQEVEIFLDLSAFVLKCHLLFLSYSCTIELHGRFPGQTNWKDDRLP